jgi:hypothetical protein
MEGLSSSKMTDSDEAITNCSAPAARGTRANATDGAKIRLASSLGALD